MRGIRGQLKENFAKDESGQGTLEYILLLCVVVVGALGFAKAMLGTLDTGILRLGGTLEKDLKTGRAEVRVWAN